MNKFNEDVVIFYTDLPKLHGLFQNILDEVKAYQEAYDTVRAEKEIGFGVKGDKRFMQILGMFNE